MKKPIIIAKINSKDQLALVLFSAAGCARRRVIFAGHFAQKR